MASISQRTACTLWLAVAVATPSQGDLRVAQQRELRILDQNGEAKFARDLQEVVYVGESSARYDTGHESFIVRVVMESSDVFLWLDHGSESYAEVPLPFRLEELLTEPEKECLQAFPRALADVEASVELTGERRKIGRWQAQGLRIESRPASRLEFEDDRWITHDLSADLEPYLLLVRSKAALSPGTRAWIEAVTDVGGYPVESKTSFPFRGRKRIVSTRLLDVEEIDSDESRYLPPPGFSRVARPPLDFQCVNAETAER